MTNYQVKDLIDRLVVGVINLGVRRIADFTAKSLVLGVVAADGLVRIRSTLPPTRPSVIPSVRSSRLGKPVALP